MQVKKMTLLLLIIFSVIPAAKAQQARVRFVVNAEHVHLEPDDEIVVRGNRPELGNWGADGELVLRPREDSSTVYRGGVRMDTTGQILYKFVVKRGDGSEEWELRGNRELDPIETKRVWFDDRRTAGIQQTLLSLTVRLDLSEHGMDGERAEGVALMGMYAPLSFDLEAGRVEMTQVEEGIWQATVNFPHGTPRDVPFKFAWLHEGEWIWEWRPGHTNHVMWLDDTQPVQNIDLKFDLFGGGVLPTNGKGYVDDYAAIIELLGERGGRSRYGYELAMQQLSAGELELARKTYRRYQNTHPGGEEIDDFHYQMAHKLRQSEGLQRALIYIDRRIEEETIPERKEYYGYLKGELALHEGDYAGAREAFKEVQATSSWELPREYSRQGLVQAYLSEPDSVYRAVELLEGYEEQVPEGKKQGYQRQLARVYRQAGMEDKEIAILEQMSGQAGGRANVSARLRLSNKYYEQGRFEQALELLEGLDMETQSLSEKQQVQRSRYQIRLYRELAMNERLLTQIEEHEQRWPEDAWSRRISKWKRQLDKERESKGGQVEEQNQGGN